MTWHYVTTSMTKDDVIAARHRMPRVVLGLAGFGRTTHRMGGNRIFLVFFGVFVIFLVFVE